MYTIILKDIDGYEITRTSEERMNHAREAARYFLSPIYAKNAGTTHKDLRTHKVEVIKDDECVWDKFI